MKSIKLQCGLTIKNPDKTIIKHVKDWYHMYDGVQIKQNNSLEVLDIALSTMLNSRISGITGGEIFAQKDSIDAALKKIPNNVDLLQVKLGNKIPGEEGLLELMDTMCSIYRVNIAVSTKIIHKKRPALVPIVDSKVKNQYTKIIKGYSAMSSGELYLKIMKLIHEDMINAKDQLIEISKMLKTSGTPMTACRIIDALTWWDGYGE